MSGGALGLVTVRLFAGLSLDTVVIQAHGESYTWARGDAPVETRWGECRVKAQLRERVFTGRLEVISDAVEPLVLATMALEEYVGGVVAREGAGLPAEARLALAVAVRSFALASGGRHEGYELCDLTHCQLWRTPTDKARADAALTEGLLLLRGGEKAKGFYSASCGGMTVPASELWPGEESVSVDDAAWHARDETWESRAELLEVVGALAGYQGVRAPKVNATGTGGAVLTLKVGSHTTGVEEFRRLVAARLGWAFVKSVKFEIENGGGTLLFRGKGRGHCVGLCLKGASAMARAGKGWRDILGAYYPDCEVGKR